MIKNSCLLLNYPKKARLIFIFAIIVVYLLTTVSKIAFAGHSGTLENLESLATFTSPDSVSSIFQDSFETGNLSVWKQTEDWEVSGVEKISGAFSLKHLAKASSGSSSIFHGIVADWNSFDIEWSFKLRNGNWDPSSSNRFWFYLSADTTGTDLIKGWAVGVNLKGTSDLLELWRIKNGKADSLIIQTDFDWNASTLATINVKRTVRGSWTLEYQNSGEEKSKTFFGNDPTISTFKNIGLYYNYTPTRAGQLWIDDITVNNVEAGLFIQQLTLINAHTIILTFNTAIDPASIHSENFKLLDENNENIMITQIIPIKGSGNSIEVRFGKADGIELSLSVSGVSGLSGKKMNPDTRIFSYSFSPEVGTILINEILFNPFSGGVDFVELVNVSEHTIPVHRLKLATRNDTLALKQIYPISTEKRYLKPGKFLTCTKDSAMIASQYFFNDPESFCEMKSFSTFSDDAGTVVLLNDSLEVLDEFSYSYKMHSPFLADEEGVSLERISLEKPTFDRSNWSSASASVGFATPGLPNSQAGSDSEIQDEITPEPQVFSPNGDGYNEGLAINYRFS